MPFFLSLCFGMITTGLRPSSLSNSQLSLGALVDQEGYAGTTCSSGVDTLADALSIGSAFSENAPKLCVALYHYQVRVCLCTVCV